MMMFPAAFSPGLAFLLLISLARSVLAQAPLGVVKACAPGVWAMTFDDGPGPETTRLLRTLRDENVKATFFVVGKNLETPAYVESVRQAYIAGHQIASHSYNHANLTAMDEAGITREMKDAEAKIAAAIGKEPVYMRPPYGECAGQCPVVMQKLGYTATLWNVDSIDWKYQEEDPWQILQNMKRFDDGKGPEAEPWSPEGVISLQHDTVYFSVEHAAHVIKRVRDKGFTFATVAECGPNRPSPYRGPAQEARNGGGGPALPAAMGLVAATAAALAGARLLF